MGSLVTALAKPILEKLMNATIEQSRYICCFSCIAEDFAKEKETLEAKRSTMAKKVEKAKGRNEDITRDVELWQERADKLTQEDTKTRMRCFFKRGKELANKTQEMKTLIMEESKFESVGITRDIPDVEFYSSQNYISFKSRESEHKKLLEALTDENNYMTGLHGMGGTGKTTLAKQVGKELKKSQRFARVVDTTVSNSPDIKKIQDDIAGPLGLSLKDSTESARPRKLMNRLTNGEKILIILDDVWEEDINFEEIGIPKKDNQSGCRILVTTRDLKVCQKMGCDKAIELGILTEEDAWMLFKKHSDLSDNSPKRIQDMGHEIVKECKGLPIAIAVIAGSLKGEERQEEWNEALQSLQNFTAQHADDKSMGEIYKCLRYSYDNMKNKIAKELFLLCSVFREDEEIDVEFLTRISIGAGLVGKIDKNYDACRNKVLVAKNKLIDSCLLLKSKQEEEEEESVKMHDLVREVALLIANDEIRAVNTSTKNEKSLVEKAKSLKYLLCEGKSMDVFSFRFDGSKLEILIVFFDENEKNSVEIPYSFFENMTGLRVLYLSGNEWRKMTLLPQSIQSLTKIRSLYLQHWILGDISILGNLRFLETLDFDYCVMDELPCKIAELEKLKLLRLFNCEIKRNNPFKVIERCSSLEELYFIRNTYSNDSSTMYQNVKLPKLQRFRIISMSVWRHQPTRNCLCISEDENMFSEVTLKHLLQKSEYLDLSNLDGRWRNVVPEMILSEDEGTHLAFLRLEEMSQLECLVDTNHIDSRIQNVFSNLVELSLFGMENLKELCSGPLPFELLKCLKDLWIENCKHLQGILFKSKLSLCNLKKLRLVNCPMLTSLFQLTTAQSLVLLERLTIEDCAELKSIIEDERSGEDLGEEIVDNKAAAPSFPNLKYLYITQCPQLSFILPMAAAPSIPNFEEIEIEDCVELKYIFGPNKDKHEEKDLHQELKEVMFVKLRMMILTGLPNFVDIFPEFDQSTSSSMKMSCSESKTQKELDPIKCNIFPWTRKYRHKLKTTKIPMDSKDQLQDSSLSSVHDSEVNDVNGQEIEMYLVDLSQVTCLLAVPQIYFSLQNVASLAIVDCKKMEVLFSASTSACLPHLRSLFIFGCNELKHVIDGDTKNQRMPFFPKLEGLFIRECNNLKCVFPISTSKILPKLQVLVIREASMLEEVFRWERDQKVEIPNLKCLVLVKLPILREMTEFHIEDYFVKDCPNLSLTSTSNLQRIRQFFRDIIQGYWFHFKTQKILEKMLDGLSEESEAQETGNRNSTAKVTEDFSMETSVQEVPGSEIDEFISMETQTKEPLKEEHELVDKVTDIEIPLIIISAADSELIRRPSQYSSDIPLDETHSHGHGEGQTIIPSLSVVNTKLATTQDIQETSKSTVIHLATNASENLSEITED